jgi:2,3-bisphosphoglycerate-independent phosphoglycerate mutase
MINSTTDMQALIKPLIQKNGTKIIFTVLDGLGGLPVEGNTELEAADTPNLDRLARSSACGMHVPVAYGITPGSGPGHLGIFGYDPVKFQIGRGILEALGLGLEIQQTDVAVRCNYSTLKDGVIEDRRAGRIPTEVGRGLTERLSENIKNIDDVEIIFAPGMEYRFAVLMRFPSPLEPEAAEIADTDPQQVGKAPLPPEPKSDRAKHVAETAAKLISRIREVIKDEEKANFALMRGFSIMPHIPSFDDAFGLKALAVAAYPMYRGLARLVGMETPSIEGSVEDQVRFLEEHYDQYDFFFLHVKKIDSNGEDGNFRGKAKRIEEFDRLLPRLITLKPDAIVVTGDHSTPCVMKSHSWHPVPVMIHSPYVISGISSSFSERECLKGELGIFPAFNIMPLVLAHTGRLKKFGA